MTDKTETKPAKRPTAAQLQQVVDGGSYTFNPSTGKFAHTRKPTGEAKQPKQAEAK